MTLLEHHIHAGKGWRFIFSQHGMTQGEAEAEINLQLVASTRMRFTEWV